MDIIHDHIPSLVALAVGALALMILHGLSRRPKISDSKALILQLLVWFVGLCLVVAVIITLPISDETRGQVLSLIGVVITAVIALSSTTFVANAMAGIMLQATEPFRPGDFIEVKGVFGRVTHRALVHTRLQTETRDFTTLPNLLMVTHPVTVLHREGTMIQADVSLGYDVHQAIAEDLLKQAAEAAGLSDPYVLVTELHDHAVGFRVAGFLSDVKNPLSARSQLRRQMLNHLHGADIEITSPAVVAQRQQPGDSRNLPQSYDDHEASVAQPPEPQDAPEQRIFDAADAAAEIETIRDEINRTQEAISAKQADIKQREKDDRSAEELALARLQRKLGWLETQLERRRDS